MAKNKSNASAAAQSSQTALGFICITKGKEHFGRFTVHPTEPEAMTEAARLAAKENKPVMVCAVLGTMRVGEPKFHREAT